MSTSPTDVNGDSAGTANTPDFSNFNLTAAQGDAGLTQMATCFLQATTNDYSGGLGVRVSALFVIMIVSTCATFFPVLATRVRRLRIPVYVYLFARYFGTGVIIATGFIHLLDPAYSEIGPLTCVGMTGGWASYSWPPALALLSCLITFLLDFAAERYVENKYGLNNSGEINVENIITDAPTSNGHGHHAPAHVHDLENRSHSHSHDSAHATSAADAELATKKEAHLASSSDDASTDADSIVVASAFRTQIAAFLVLEFGVIFHSVIIGLALGSAGAEFGVLYPVIVFHQSFEGLGIGARLSAIPFPTRYRSLPWLLCAAYGLTTPLAIAVGLGVRTTYNSGSFTASIVSGVLDSLSAGILIYTGLVELLARDFLFDPKRTMDGRRLGFMVACVVLGAGMMALLGKWA